MVAIFGLKLFKRFAGKRSGQSFERPRKQKRRARRQAIINRQKYS